MRSNLLRSFLIAFLLLIDGVTAFAASEILPHKTSWVGNTFGFSDGTWMQLDVRAIAVANDGTVYTNAPWDESGAEISAYKNGKVLAVAGNTHGWGNAGGDAIAINDKYLYAAVSISNERGKLFVPFIWPPKGKIWFGVTRRLRSDISKGAPFEGGAGNLGKPVARSFLLINEANENSPDFVNGLAASNSRLYVSNFLHDEVDVYDAESMKFINRWKVSGPGKLSINPLDQSVWLLSDKSGSAKILHFSGDGKPLKDGFSLPEEINPSDIHVDLKGQIFIADSGVSQQIFVYSKTNGEYRNVDTFGEKKGILSSPKGKVGPLRFDGLTGVGTDAAGNIYVAMNGVGIRPHTNEKFTILGASLESYSENKARNWSTEADAFVGGSQVDPEHPEIMLTATKEFSYDYDLPNGKNWKYIATLVDRFQQPNGVIGPILAARVIPYLRNINGRRFLYALDQRGRALSIYRYDSANGSIPIVSGLMISRNFWSIEKGVTGAGGGIWRDVNGDQQFDSSEWFPENKSSVKSTATTATSWSVDDAGGVWIGRSADGLREFPLQGFDDSGNPIYAYSSVVDYSPPAPFNWVQQAKYDVQTDSLYISGYTKDKPYDPKYWGQTGVVLAKYPRWSKGNRNPSYVINLPWDASRTPVKSTASFDVEKDYIFTIEVMDGTVSIFSSKNGQYVGEFKPGEEVGNYTGWIDVSDGVRAFKRSNGEYVITAEEDARGKFIVYRWTPRAAANAPLSN